MLISVIIPIFNSKNFLPKCIESVISQSYKNLQIILVDDGSTDGSSEICDSYKNKDKRISVIHQENKGVSEARNNGIKFSKGQYTMLLDSDDWLDSDFIECCVNATNDGKYDLVFTPYIREYKNRSIINYIFGDKNITFDKKSVKNILIQKLIGPVNDDLKNPAGTDDFSSSCGRLYRTIFCKKIQFCSLKDIGSEDAWFNLQYCLVIKNAKYIIKTNYHYNKQNVNSIISTYNSEEFKWRCRFYSHVEKYIKNHNLDSKFEEGLNNRKITDLIGLSNNIFNSNLSLFGKAKEEKKILQHKLYKNAFHNFPFSKLPIKWKIFFYLCKDNNIPLLTLCCLVGEKEKRYLK